MSDEKGVIDLEDDEFEESLVTEEHLEGMVEGEGVLYGALEVAKELGISHDMVRYYANKFSEYLSMEKASNKKRSHYRYTPKDVEVLRAVLAMKDQGRTIEEIKKVFDQPEMDLYLGAKGKAGSEFARLLTENNALLMDKFAAAMREAMVQMMNQQQEKELIDKQHQEEVFEHILGEVTNRMDELQKENQELKEMILELIDRPNERRGGLFGLFRKNR